MNKQIIVLSVFLFAFSIILSGCHNSGKAKIQTSINKHPAKTAKYYTSNDLNFNKFAMWVYKNDKPYIYASTNYIYDVIPISTTMSGHKLISIVRVHLKYKPGEKMIILNYSISKGKKGGKGEILKIEKTNDKNWGDLQPIIKIKLKPIKINLKPYINIVIAETKQYGKAKANFLGYRIIGMTQTYNNKSIYIYVLKGIKLEAMMMY